MLRGHRQTSLAALLAVLGFASSAPAVSEDAFQLRTGQDLVALCSTPPGDPLYMAAIHMCHGYGAGAYQGIKTLTSHRKLKPVLCPPDPPPTRNEAVRRFLDWANGNPQYLSDPAIEVVGRFFVTQFPCPKEPGKEAR